MGLEDKIAETGSRYRHECGKRRRWESESLENERYLHEKDRDTTQKRELKTLEQRYN